jgi:hypothetical protein
MEEAEDFTVEQVLILHQLRLLATSIHQINAHLRTLARQTSAGGELSEAQRATISSLCTWKNVFGEAGNKNG